MSDEIKAAAERWKAMRYGSEATHGSTLNADAHTLANAYLADLATREAEERERAIPIDEEWLQSLGFAFIRSHIGPEYGDDMQLDRLEIWDYNGECWLMTGAEWFEMTTRGHILDLMLATETKAKPKDAA